VAKLFVGLTPLVCVPGKADRIADGIAGGICGQSMA
jgi:hypothetical protein